MPLTDVMIRNAKPTAKSFKLYDTSGLYLEISPSGGKWWRLKYRFNGKENRISLGVYPDVSLSNARERRSEARKKLANGIDPSRDRKAQKSADRGSDICTVHTWELVIQSKTDCVENRRLSRPGWARNREYATVTNRLLIKVDFERIREASQVLATN
jgi:hypothetical protein